MSVNVSLREDIAQRLEHALAPAHADQPVVNNRNTH